MRHLRPVISVALFASLWVGVTLSLGTFTLLGPVHWLTDHARANGFGTGRENMMVLSVLLLLLAATLLLSERLFARLRSNSPRGVRAAIAVGVGGCALLVLAGWFRPQLMNAGAAPAAGVRLATGAEFVFGAYPTATDLQRLQKEGFTGVISLLHPAVPFEPKLLSDERHEIARTRLTLISAPMLPWVLENRQSLDRIAALAQRPGRYYVHCYLGRDRVNLVRRRIEGQRGKLAIRPEGSLEPVARQVSPFRHGEVRQLDQGIWLMPAPTDEEFGSYVAAGSFRHVLLVGNPADPADTAWIERNRRRLESFSMAYTVVPVTRSGEGVTRVTSLLAAGVLQRPLAIIVRATEPEEVGGAAARLLEARRVSITMAP